MSKTTHTPRPWLAYNADNGRIFKHWRIRGACVRNDPPFAVIDSNGKLSPEYEAANARLMAAAPELLESLQGMLEVFADDTGDCEDMKTVIAARAAIAKAGGAS